MIIGVGAAWSTRLAVLGAFCTKDLKSNYPDGVYQLEVDTTKAPLELRDWHFVVADHQCNTTDILSFPHEPKRQ